MTVITRFAPSPTGFLHIGGARTALFNWLYAKHHNGKFLLRIEDTDRERSTTEAINAILEGINWLELTPDEDPIYQSSRIERHTAIAHQLLQSGKAYYCYTSAKQLETMREQARQNKQNFIFRSPWRDNLDMPPPTDTKPVIRLKIPDSGKIVTEDRIQGSVTIACKDIEDFVILRSDGTPTYMLAVVVDDHDMGVTHVIRGDDHLNNTAKQIMIYNALNWRLPVFAHIPLIHGADGAKLSKRHGALGVSAYQEMGYLPEAMNNYLLRLGWSHGNEEIITRKQAIEWFNLENIGKSPARFDIAKLENLNAHYIRMADNDRLLKLITPILEQNLNIKLNADAMMRLGKAMNSLKERAKTIVALAENAAFYIYHPQPVDDKAKTQLANNIQIVHDFIPILTRHTDWNRDSLMNLAKQFAEQQNSKLGKIMAPMRVAITGTTASPSMFEVMEILGKDEVLRRLNKVIAK